MLQIVLEKIIIMFMILALGILCLKKNILDEPSVRKLSSFLLKVVNPIVIFVSYQMTFSDELFANLGYAFILSIGAFAIQIAIAYLLVNKKGIDAAIERLGLIYSNCGFFGIPLASALFGREGVFYLTAYLTIFYLFFWTHGVILMTGKTGFRDTVKNLLSPAVVGVLLGLICFVFSIRLPEIIVLALDNVGSMNTPLAMLIAGATLGQSDIMSCFSNPRIYWLSAIKLVIIPFAVALVLSVLSFSPVMLLVIIIAVACPVAASCTMFAIQYGKDSIYASQIFIVTTLLSIASIPLIIFLAGLLGVTV